MYKLIIICFLILNFSSCKNSKEKKFVSEEASNASFNEQKKINTLSSDYEAVYLKYDTLKSNYEFGNIVITDLNKKESVLLVDNTYFNTSPIWSPDGQQILFASARIGDLDRLRIIKKSARKQLYSYDLNKSKLVEFFNPKFSTHPRYS